MVLPNAFLIDQTDSAFRHRLELKSEVDRTLGVGVGTVGSESAVLILTATTMIKAFLEIDHIHEFTPESVFMGYL